MGRKRKQPFTEVNPIKNINTWYIGLYIRLSREDGNEVSDSVINQEKILREYITSLEDEHNHFIIVDRYIDDGQTGTDTNREDFIRLQQDILQKKINCVIVKSLARAFRNLGDQSKFLEEFVPLHNVRFICLSGPKIDTYVEPVSVNNLEVPISGMMNERYAAVTSEEVRKTFDMKRRQGEFIGAFAPYGYMKHPENKNRLVIDEEAAEVVRDIYNSFLYGIDNGGTGLSLNAIAKELNEKGVPSPAEYKKQKGFKYKNPHAIYSKSLWTGTTIRRLMQNKVYIGYTVQGKNRVISYKIHKQIAAPENEWYVVENTHEPVIDKAMFDAVQKLLKRDTRIAPGKTKCYLFSGFLHCGKCGRALRRKQSRNYLYYCCRTKTVSPDSCEGTSISNDKLEKAVLSAIQMQIELVSDLSKLVDKVNAAPRVNNQSKRLNNLLQKHNDDLKKITFISDGLHMDWKSGDITREEYLHLKSDYSAKIEALQQAINKIQQECDMITSGVKSYDNYFTEFAKYKNVKALDRDIIVTLIDSITIHNSNDITITFRYADRYQNIIDSIENNNKELVLMLGGETV